MPTAVLASVGLATIFPSSSITPRGTSGSTTSLVISASDEGSASNTTFLVSASLICASVCFLRSSDSWRGVRKEGIPGPRTVPKYSPLLLSEFGRKLAIDATWTSTLSQEDFHYRGLKDDYADSRVPTRFEPPDIRPLGDLRLIVGCKIPPIFICVAFPEMGRLVIIWGVVIVKQLEGCKTTLCIQNQRLLARDRGKTQNLEAHPFDLLRESTAWQETRR